MLPLHVKQSQVEAWMSDDSFPKERAQRGQRADWVQVVGVGYGG